MECIISINNYEEFRPKIKEDMMRRGIYNVPIILNIDKILLERNNYVAQASTHPADNNGFFYDVDYMNDMR